MFFPAYHPISVDCYKDSSLGKNCQMLYWWKWWKKSTQNLWKNDRLIIVKRQSWKHFGAFLIIMIPTQGSKFNIFLSTTYLQIKRWRMNFWSKVYILNEKHEFKDTHTHFTWTFLAFWLVTKQNKQRKNMGKKWMGA